MWINFVFSLGSVAWCGMMQRVGATVKGGERRVRSGKGGRRWTIKMLNIRKVGSGLANRIPHNNKLRTYLVHSPQISDTRKSGLSIIVKKRSPCR